MDEVRLLAPAKVNLYLQVLGRRPDGYHDLRMLMAPVSWFDRLRVERLEHPGRVEMAVEGRGGPPPGEDNLCVRAARFYFAKAGVSGGARIRLRKRIPAGAGLGGGSSDAAAVVMGLERLFGRALPGEARRRAAFAVGADVPFFFARGPAWVEGIGERVRALPGAGRPLWLTLVWPGAFLSTGSVFSRLTKGLTSPGAAPRIAQFNFQGVARGLRNDLQAAALIEMPAIGSALGALRRAGADHALMSGSGSAVFGLLPGAAEAARVARTIRRMPEAQGWEIRVVRTLPPLGFPFREAR